MDHLKKPSRREFLANMSYSLGLVSAGHLFNRKIWAQGVTPITRVIHIFFPHGILSKGDMIRGNWLINNNSPLKALQSVQGDCRFIRNVDQRSKRIPESHTCNQSSFLTGCSTNKTHGAGSDLGNNTGTFGGTSIDIAAGEYLKNKYKTEVGSLVLGISDQHGDGNTASSPFLWETVSWNRNKSPRLPILQPSKVFADLNKYKQKLISCQEIPPNQDEIKNKIKIIDREVVKLNLVKDNLKNYYSENLMPKVEMDKLEKQVIDNITSKNKEKDGYLAVLEGNMPSENNNSSCGELINPGTRFDKNPALSTHAGGDRTNDKGFNGKAATQMDLMMYALKSNYTRSATLTLGGRIYQRAHPAGHLKVPGLSKDQCFTLHNAYVTMIGNTIATLVNKLKSQGLYDSTMVVVCGEFGNQKNGTHKSTNLPWLVINSGKSGEHNNGAVHPGDIHTGTMNRIGNVAVKSFGSSDSRLNRAGRLNTDIF